jgi:hypothetical protein
MSPTIKYLPPLGPVFIGPITASVLYIFLHAGLPPVFSGKHSGLGVSESHPLQFQVEGSPLNLAAYSLAKHCLSCAFDLKGISNCTVFSIVYLVKGQLCLPRFPKEGVTTFEVFSTVSV